MSRRAPRAAGESIRELADRIAPASTLGAVQRVWPQAVGEAFAPHARPTAEAGGTLTVTCSSAVWSHELDLLGPQVIARLDELLGPGRVRALRCQSVPARSWSRMAD